MNVSTASNVRKLQALSNQQVTEYANMQRIVRQWYGNQAMVNWASARLQELELGAATDEEYQEWEELQKKYDDFSNQFLPVYHCWLRTLREITILVVELENT